MKKLTLLLLIGLFFNSCAKKEKHTLSEYCGQYAVYSTSGGQFTTPPFYLGFEKNKGAGVELVEVSQAEYFTYKDGEKPISCK